MVIIQIISLNHRLFLLSFCTTTISNSFRLRNFVLVQKHSWHPPPPSFQEEVQLDTPYLWQPHFNQLFYTDSVTTPSSKTYSNPTLQEKSELNNLNNNQSIVIKPCDKGGVTCIMNTRDYLTKIHTYLQDRNAYNDSPTTQQVQ